MPEAIITTPKGPTYQTVTTWTTYKDDDGREIEYGKTCRPYRANETITKGQFVAFVAATATVPLSVEVLDVSDAIANFVCCGVAQEAGVAGDIISVCIEGPCIANIDDTGTTALGDIVTKHATTDGAAAVIANATWTADATAAGGPGKALGFYLGAEIGTTNQSPIYFHKF